jgi:SAM-dependent methyltransferase
MMDSYTILADSYDLLTTDVGYPQWADYVQWHFDRQVEQVRTVVELACGTGSLTKLLAQRGYEMTAIDLSPDMLTVAADKCEGLPVRFVCQDMSRLALPEPVDAVICCLDSINYVTRPIALQKTFRKVFRFLKPGGLFLFDVKTPLALERADDQIYLDETEDLYCVWRGEYDPKRRICGYGIDLFHEEYAYTLQELEGWLQEAGFTGIRQYGNLKKRQPKDDEERVFFAARKGF